MNCIKKFTPDHYEYYIDKANSFIGGHIDIDSWIRNLTDKNVLLWLRVIKRAKEDTNDVYFQEIAIFLTLIIRLFALELGVTNDIELKNSEIKKLVNRFEYAIKREYGARKQYLDEKEGKYSLLYDIKKG